jgi:DNA-binding beta-propeller fold protein YncE
VNSDKGYLSAGSLQGSLLVIDFESFSIIDTILVGKGPETMILEDDRVYVANSGGWGNDSTISVINAITDEVEDIIVVEQVPVDMVLDAGGKLWVYCKGFTNYAEIETESYLQKIDPQSKTVLWQSPVGMALDYASVPAKCAVSKDGTVVYYLRPDGVYSVPASLPELSEEPLIEGNFYGLEINPVDGNIYVFESSFSGNGMMKIYSTDGNLLSEGVVGIGPNGAVFNL